MIKSFMIKMLRGSKEMGNRTKAINKYYKAKLCRKKRVFIFGTPYHSNLGDQAQTYCIERWAKKNLQNCQVISFSTRELNFKNYYILNKINKIIRQQDLILIQSGYNTTDIYIGEERLHRAVISTYKNNKIVLFPQTVYFKDKKEQETTKRIYNSNKNVTFLARDEISYKTANEMFTEIPVYLYPDVVTSLIGSFSETSERNGVLFCMRNDCESAIKSDKMNEITNAFKKKWKVDRTDTTLSVNANKIISNRHKYIYDTFNMYKKYSVIITDRYHGTIFSLITNTPVIILPTTDHKLSSGVLWFNKLQEYNKYVYYCDDLAKLEQMTEDVISTKERATLSPYFEREYYDKLLQKIF